MSSTRGKRAGRQQEEKMASYEASGPRSGLAGMDQLGAALGRLLLICMVVFYAAVLFFSLNGSF